jgi:hypothetical protein
VRYERLLKSISYALSIAVLDPSPARLTIVPCLRTDTPAPQSSLLPLSSNAVSWHTMVVDSSDANSHPLLTRHDRRTAPYLLGAVRGGGRL